MICLWQDVDEFFESEKTFLMEYHSKIKDATSKSDRMTKCHGGIVNHCHNSCKFRCSFWFSNML